MPFKLTKRFIKMTTESFYFGPEASQLYGTYHEPVLSADLKHGILLCNPFGQEYIRIHRSFKQLAERLSMEGFSVLRFDFFGCGDSYGSLSEASFERWVKDVACAADELRESAETRNISIIGLRLGAAIAMQYIMESGNAENLILWEPVIDGRQYLTEVFAAHKKWMEDQLNKAESSGELEVLGFEMPGGLKLEIEALHLENTAKLHLGGDALIIANADREQNRTLVRQFKNSNVVADLEVVAAPAVWLREQQMDKSLVPNQTLSFMTNWLKEVVS